MNDIGMLFSMRVVESVSELDARFVEAHDTRRPHHINNINTSCHAYPPRGR